MKSNQINLGDRPVEQNKTFLKTLYESQDLEGARKWFDQLDCSVSIERQIDREMTLDTYLGLMTDQFQILLRTDFLYEDLIRYSVYGSDENGVTRFVWLECPLNERNYDLVARLFHDVYKQNIEPK